MKYKDIYTEEGREEQVENDAINPLEAGFMEGYDIALAYY